MTQTGMYIVKCQDSHLGELFFVASARSVQDALDQFWARCNEWPEYRHITEHTHLDVTKARMLEYYDPFSFDDSEEE